MSTKPNEVYFGEGVSIPGGPWTAAMFETKQRLYEVRRYHGGRLVFMVNCRVVESLPDTPGARKAFEAALTMEGPIA